METFKTLEHGLQTDRFSGEAVGGYSIPISYDAKSKTRRKRVSDSGGRT